jgi:hypothetical protein
MALAKLSACAAGCAIIGGGAVHVAETQRKSVEYRKVKMAKTAKPRHPAKRIVRKDPPREVKRARRIIPRPDVPQMVSVPLPPPYIPPAPAPSYAGGSGGAPVVVGGGGGGVVGLGGGFFGGFFGGGGSGGGNVNI